MAEQTPDHDILITLVAKVDNLTVFIKDINDGLAKRVTILETRTDAIDLYHAKVDLDHYHKNMDWIDSLRSNYKLVIGLIGLTAGLLGGLIDHVIQSLFPFLK